MAKITDKFVRWATAKNICYECMQPIKELRGFNKWLKKYRWFIKWRCGYNESEERAYIAGYRAALKSERGKPKK